MPRNMSFALTVEQIKNRTKTVTRRTGWKFLKVGNVLNAVNKTMGFKKGEKPVHLAKLRVVSVGEEPLGAITAEDVKAEGFSILNEAGFLELFKRMHPKITPKTLVNRIEFEYLD